MRLTSFESNPDPESSTAITTLSGEYDVEVTWSSRWPSVTESIASIAEAVLVSTARQPRKELLPGRYFYCGSANGPGGLRSRLARHMRHGKALHWHIDQLTERGTVTSIWIVRNGQECDLVAMLAPLPMPIPGFGSSDCSRCLSHLLYLRR